MKTKATVVLFLDKRRKKKDDRFPLKLTVYSSGDKKRYDLRIDFTESEWDKINGEKLRDEELKIKRMKLQSLITRANEIIDKMEFFSFD